MASSNPWNRTPSMESTPSPLQRVTDKFAETSLSSGGSGGDGSNDQTKIGKGWRRFSASPTPSVSPSSPDDVVRGGSGGVSAGRGPARSPESGDKNGGGPALSREQREAMRFAMVKRKKDFRHMERVGKRTINVVEGLELHTGVFSAAEQKRIVDCVYDFQEKGQKGQLRERTYSQPRKWMRGKGRVTIQFGCCYNYAVDKNGNPPGIIRDEEVDPIPPLLKMMIKRMVAWHVLPPTCIPNSCIVNIYDKDDCIPPHIDHHDFVRPFCTVSFLAECNILFGAKLEVLGPGEFSGSIAIPLPLGSVLILKGNGADVAKHCVPAVPAKRISITFRKMDDSKLPFRFVPDPDLQNLKPLPYPPNGSPVPVQRVGSPLSSSPVQASTPSQVGQVVSPARQNPGEQKNESEGAGEEPARRFKMGQDDFPPLGLSSGNAKPRRSLRQ
ncbi:Uncharacterized protein M6B38_211625 [Iris pallida]|uniref:Fe2OG dioxygenase domain-containing protein n=1 Tax=Iris pallida TaxID=29817 RepID=A0AAX6E2T3_IRIPA|nr:Uncharacterized protein M6B38_211625 [Iris pallida]